jgi:hypothetical protein
MHNAYQLDNRAVEKVKSTLFKNYKDWCEFLGRQSNVRCVYSSLFGNLTFYQLCDLILREQTLILEAAAIP